MFRETVSLRAFALVRIPMLLFLSPSVVEISDRRCVVKIPLSYRSRNHLGSMYFGTLACGADLAGGLMAMRLIRASGANVALIFKDFRAEFLRRVEHHCYFTCEEGERIRALVAEAIASGERVEAPVRVTATVPARDGDDPAALFTLTLSLKRRA